MTDSISSFKIISKDYAIVGSIDQSQLELLANKYKSALYLALDTPKDSSIEGGFNLIKSAFNGSAIHTPFDSSIHATPNSNYPITAMDEYNKYVDALNILESPTVVICASNRRASAVLAAYLGVKDGKDAETVINESVASELSYVNMAPLSNWVKTVVAAASPTK